jgi:argininosuccinate lyase
MSTVKQEIDSRQLWASRFKKATNAIGKQYSESITVDRPMFNHDIWGNQAHTIMLGYTGINTDEQTKNILIGLQEVRQQFEAGQWDLQFQEEDLQMNVERFVINHVGMENGGRMHTTRSRNDQVVLDTKLFARHKLREVQTALGQLVETLLSRASNHTQTIMPGYTHTQHAQPMTYAYWLTNYAAVLLRDLRRLAAADQTLNTNPLGAGALTGTSFPIDRDLTTELMGFDSVQEHCLDAVGNKDFNLEILAALAIMFSSLSRIAEEVIYGITQEFRTMVLDDSFAMGSSMMPQKKNPGVLELVRGRTGKMYGILMAMLTTMKGLPSGYNRDYHEDKTTLLESLTLSKDSIEVIQGVIETLQINRERMRSLVEENFATATELANYLVRKHDIPFRQCHRIVGYVVGELVARGKSFKDKQATRELLGSQGIDISDEDFENTLDPQKVVENYTSRGGTSSKEVDRMIRSMKKELDSVQGVLNARIVVEREAHEKTLTISQEILKGVPVKDAVKTVLKTAWV